MCGPSDDRDLGNLYPAVDNDDGSQHYFIAENVAVYGGMKNYLGLNKKWVKNLIVHPGRWSGDACLTAWGGQEHVYSENTCITNNGFPQAFDSSVEGDKCTFNYSDVTSAPFLPSTHGNVYSTPDGTFATGKSTQSNPRAPPGRHLTLNPGTHASRAPAHLSPHRLRHHVRPGRPAEAGPGAGLDGCQGICGRRRCGAGGADARVMLCASFVLSFK